MCRNITELRGLQPAATAEEIAAAARQYVRKVSGITHPSARQRRSVRGRRRRGHRDDDPIAGHPAAAAPAAEDGPAVAPARGAGPDRGRNDTTARPALKEWSAVVHALLDGRQRVLLRKGGIGEKRFEVAAAGIPAVPDGRAQPRRAGPARAPRPAGRRRRRHRPTSTCWSGRPRKSLPHCRLTARTTSTQSRICTSGPPSRCAPTGSTSGPSTNWPCWWCPRFR